MISLAPAASSSLCRDPVISLIQAGCAPRVSGTDLDGTYERSLAPPRYAQQGTWRINIETGDNASNQQQHNNLGVVNQTGAGDTASPTVVSIISAPSSVDTSASAQVVTVQAHVTDDLAGTSCVFITLSGPSNQLIQAGCAPRVSGTDLDGTYERGLTLPRYAQQGTWRINIETGDNASNQQQHNNLGTLQVIS